MFFFVVENAPRHAGGHEVLEKSHREYYIVGGNLGGYARGMWAQSRRSICCWVTLCSQVCSAFLLPATQRASAYLSFTSQFFSPPY